MTPVQMKSRNGEVVTMYITVCPQCEGKGGCSYCSDRRFVIVDPSKLRIVPPAPPAAADENQEGQKK